MPHRPVPALAVAILLTGCASPADRVADDGARVAALFEAGEWKQARRAARDVLRVAPKNVQARYVLARMAERDGEIGQMLGHLEVVIGEDSAHVPARLTLATMLVHAQDYDGARLLLNQLKILAPDDPEVRLLEARLQVRTGAVDAGIAALDSIIARHPDHAEAALLRGLAYAGIDPDLGLADLANAIQRLGKADTTALRLARIGILHREGRTASLEAELKALVRDRPDGGHGRALAAFYLEQGRPDEAEQALAAAVAAEPGNAGLRLALAELESRRRNEPALVERTLKELMVAAPANAELPLLLGKWYEGSGRLDEARARYEAVVRRDARDGAGCEARVRIADLDLAAGRRSEARAALDAVLGDCPDQVEALVIRGRMNGEEGRLDDAVADLRGALRKAPGDHGALLAMARVHMARADWTLARDAYHRLLEASPWPSDPVILAGRNSNSTGDAIVRLGAELGAGRDVVRNGASGGILDGIGGFTGSINGQLALFQEVSGS